MTKKIFSLLLCLLFLVPTLCSAKYLVTKEELTELESILTQLEINNNQLLVDLTLSKVDLQEALIQLRKSQEDLALLKTQLIELKNESQQAKLELLEAQSLLDKANQSLLQYEKEVKRKISSLKRQKNIAYVLAGSMIIYAATK